LPQNSLLEIENYLVTSSPFQSLHPSGYIPKRDIGFFVLEFYVELLNGRDDILRKCCRMPRPVGGDECSDSKNPINRPRQGGIVRRPHFRRGWKASAIREAPPCGREASLTVLETLPA